MIIGIVGPTGIGKSACAIELAKRLGGQIISVDAYQIYRGMDIGTGKVTASQRAQVPHHFIDTLAPHERSDVATFQRQVRATLDGLLTDEVPVIMVGGSGYYFKAVLHDMQFSADLVNVTYPPVETIIDTLQQNAPELLEGVHLNNHKRLLNRYTRYLSNTPPSDPSRAVYDYQLFGLTMPLADLHARIDARIDQMVEAGLEDEVRALEAKGLSHTAASAIGYKEWRPYWAGVTDKKSVIQLIKTHTRQYIKKQTTYFAHQLPVTWLDAKAHDTAALTRQILSQVNR